MEDTGTAVASTPASGGESGASSAPAPNTFAEAFARDASLASPQATDPSDAAAAAQPDGSETSPQQQDDRSPFIPRARFDEVNNSLKELKAWKEQRAWAEQVNPHEFAQIQQIAKHFAGGDTIAGIQALLAEARKDPAVDAQLRSFYGRALAQARSQQAQAPSEPQPDLPIQLEDGRVVHLYSADQQAKREAWLQQQWLSQVEQKFQPVTQTIETLQAERAAAERTQQIEHFVTTTYQDVATWPGMESKDAQAAVARELAAARIDPNDPREVQIALNAAYRRVVLPTLGKQAEAKLLESLKTKAAAATSVNPGSAAASTPRSVRSFKDLGEEAWR